MGSPPLFSSLTSLASGRVTALPRWSMGVITMKMMRSTSTTSTSGVTLMSLLTPLLPTSIDMTEFPGRAWAGLARPSLMKKSTSSVVESLTSTWISSTRLVK